MLAKQVTKATAKTAAKKTTKRPAARKRRPAASAPEGSAKPLPPPIEFPQPDQRDQDPLNLNAMFEQNAVGDFGDSSQKFSTLTTDHVQQPQPGAPLSVEAEKVLAGVEPIEDEIEADGSLDEPSAQPSLIPSIDFDADKVRGFLEEGFDWLAKVFESDHWKLTNRQADMLARPTAELLGGIWTRLQDVLPEMLTSTPGATALLFACSFVVVPKAAQQMAISKARKSERAVGAVTNPRPVPISREWTAGPVEPMQSGPVEPLRVAE